METTKGGALYFDLRAARDERGVLAEDNIGGRRPRR